MVVKKAYALRRKFVYSIQNPVASANPNKIDKIPNLCDANECKIIIIIIIHINESFRNG